MMVDAAPVKAHIAALAEAGASRYEVAKLAGVNKVSLKHTALHAERVWKGTADAVLAVQLRDTSIARAVGVKRRLQGLMLLGYSLKSMGDASGMERSQLSLLLSVEDRVSEEVHARVVAMTRQLVAAGPSTEHYRRQNRTRALHRGYTPLFDWDDLDDPTEKPKGVKAA